MDQTHTIIMVQFNEDAKTRSYLHFATLNEALESLMELYEATLQAQSSGLAQASYEILELFEYIEKLYDLTFLTYSIQIQGYIPRGKDWCKLKLNNLINAKAIEIGSK